jgi:site-specific recombinase XerD
MCLQSKHSFKAYGRDLVDFVRHMEAQGIDPLRVTADHVKLYKRALLEAGLSKATLARRLSVLRGTYKQLAAKGLIAWETAQNIAAIKAPQVQENSTPSLTQKQAIALLEAIPTDTLQGVRDFALMSVFFLTGCSAKMKTEKWPRGASRSACPVARAAPAEDHAWVWTRAVSLALRRAPTAPTCRR